MTWKTLILATLSTALLAGLPNLTWAADKGAALYKKKCAGCHGHHGEGKPGMKAPALKGTSLSEDKISDHITNGEPESKPPHNKGISGISGEQAKAIGDFIKTLK
jgi:mono/diheme cytochrome c family protein